MSAFSTALKTWRKTRRLSQLGLATEAGVSSRHLAFLETGRARPSREMIARLSEAMDLPLTARNHLMGHAGFAVRHLSRNWDDAEMGPVKRAVDHLLKQHAPYPAVAIDQMWTVVRLNEPAGRLFSALGIASGSNLLDFALSPEAAQLIENWPQVAHYFACRLRTESSALGGVERFEFSARQLDHSASYDGEPIIGPVLPVIMRLGDVRLSMFTMLAQFGAPQDLVLSDFRVETYFPGDDATEAFFRAMGREAKPLTF